MIEVYPFAKKIFFVAKDNKIIYSTHPDFKVGDEEPLSYVSVEGDNYIENHSEDNEIIKEWVVNYFKENEMYEYLI